MRVRLLPQLPKTVSRGAARDAARPADARYMFVVPLHRSASGGAYHAPQTPLSVGPVGAISCCESARIVQR